MEQASYATDNNVTNVNVTHNIDETSSPEWPEVTGELTPLRIRKSKQQEQTIADADCKSDQNNIIMYPNIYIYNK
jgi:hypothetical protein